MKSNAAIAQTTTTHPRLVLDSRSDSESGLTEHRDLVVVHERHRVLKGRVVSRHEPIGEGLQPVLTFFSAGVLVVPS